MTMLNGLLLYLINIHQLTVNFDWSRAGHLEGDILSGHPAMLPSNVIYFVSLTLSVQYLAFEKRKRTKLRHIHSFIYQT